MVSEGETLIIQTLNHSHGMIHVFDLSYFKRLKSTTFNQDKVKLNSYPNKKLNENEKFDNFITVILCGSKI